MDGARAEEAAARDLMAKLSASTVSPWTIAELFLLGDGAIADLEQLARGAFGPAPERRSLGPKILAAIGTPSARAALRRLLVAYGATENDASAGAADSLVSREVAAYLEGARGARRVSGPRVGDAIELRGPDGTA